MTEPKILKNPWQASVVGVLKDGKSVKVEIPRIVIAPKYGKRQNLKTSMLVDANLHVVKIGDVVNIVPARKISKLKSWKIVAIVKREDVV